MSHGANAAETLPISAGEFGSDALAAFRALDARHEVTVGAVLGHSMGAIGAILAAAEEPRIAAVVSTSAPADPWRLTRQTFHILMEGTPSRIDAHHVEESLRAIEGVREVHDLHLWTLTSGVDSLNGSLAGGVPVTAQRPNEP